MGELSGKNILFFSPKFFNYEIEIKNALEDAGANVVWHDERPSNSFTTKALIRLNKKFLSNKITTYYNKILRDLSGKSFDYIFIVSPESMQSTHLKALKKEFNHSVVILYMWDSFKNKGAIQLLPLIDRGITFDKNDAIKYNLSLRALFYIDAYKAKGVEPIYDLLFTGTAHSDRYDFVKKVISKLPRLKVKLFFFLSSKKLFWAKKITDKDFKSVRLEDISFIPLNGEKTASLVHQSKIILDVNHPNQIGLTMRTFETLGAQKKLITTNSDIVNYDFYNSKNVLVINRENPEIPIAFLHDPFIPSNNSILEKYSIKGWVNEIFNT